jgi:NMD protein affecting ribosome stability and mRNA decay
MTFACGVCGVPVERRWIELDEECRVVCMDCYVAGASQEEIDAALTGIETATYVALLGCGE